MSNDYYGILGVSQDASGDEIRRAYRKLARQYHPDVNPDEDAQARFKQIGRAYEVLSSPQKRQMYDAGADPYAPGGGMGGMGGFGAGGPGFSFTDIMDAFFGQAGQRGPKPRVQRGQSARVPLTLTLAEAAFGAEREIKLDTAVVCSQCSGEGTATGTSYRTCSTCSGSGEVQQTTRSLLGDVRTVHECPTCRGFGNTIPTPCPECSGEGRVQARRVLTVKVPSGVDTGIGVQLSGEGEVGRGGGPSGDLLVEITVEPDERFIREGDDLHTTVTLPMTAAALGTTIKLPTLDGEPVDLEIKPGTQSGAQTVLRERGVPRLRRTGRGDLVVTIVVVTPTKLDDTQRDLLRQLADARGEEDPDGRTHVGAGKSVFGRLRDAFGQH